jgi:HD-like signal output (HDOD) protein
MTPRRRDVSSLAATLTRLKPFPGSVAAVRKLGDGPDASVSAVAGVIERDVGVATDLLRIANAPTSALAQKCTSVRHAASLLGLRRVCQLVESAAALAFVEQSAAAFPELAARVLSVAGVARMLAPITGLSPDDVFTAALLHDVGMLLLVQSDDPFYEGLFDAEGAGEEPSVDDELALMGFDHAELGAAVVRNWNLPAPLPEVVALHHDWAAAVEVGGQVCAIVALLRVADALIPMLRSTATPLLDELTPLLAEEPAFGYLGIKREELHQSWDGLRRSCEKASLLEDVQPLAMIRTSAPTPAVARAVAPNHDFEPTGHPQWLLVGAAAAVVAGGVLAVVLY